MVDLFSLKQYADEIPKQLWIAPFVEGVNDGLLPEGFKNINLLVDYPTLTVQNETAKHLTTKVQTQRIVKGRKRTFVDDVIDSNKYARYLVKEIIHDWSGVKEDGKTEMYDAELLYRLFVNKPTTLEVFNETYIPECEKQADIFMKEKERFLALQHKLSKPNLEDIKSRSEGKQATSAVND